MERALVLQILDTAWKDHLLAMDHLRSSVGLRGYAQVDPKVEYKREGMRTVRGMWTSVGERRDRPDLPHGTARRRLRRLAPGSKAKRPQEDAKPASEIERQQQAAIDGTEADKKIEPIRNRSRRSAATIPAPAAAARSTRTAACAKGVSRCIEFVN